MALSMDTIRILFSQPWVERLGSTLVHFLWQGMLISALYAFVRGCASHSGSPNTRYRVACGALAVMLAAPIVTFLLIGPSDVLPVATHHAGGMPSAASAAASAVAIAMPASLRDSAPGIRTARFLPWVVAIWLLGAMALWMRLMGGWIVAARMPSRLVRPAPPEWQEAFNRLRTRIRVSRPVGLLISALVEVPTVVGWLRPVVLVPVGALAGLPPEQVEALLLHELAHIRRHDYLVNILQNIAEALLFYHPAVWWVSRHIRDERELCCDDLAVSAIGGDALTYASALAELESCRPAHFQAAMAANGGSLAVRIARVLGKPHAGSRSMSGPGIMISTVVIFVTAFTVYGQSQAVPKFEVASVKLNVSGDRRGMRLRVQPGGGLSTENTSLQLLTQNAYGLQSFQISGGPGWYQSDGYNIEAKGEVTTEAKSDAKVNRSQVYLMLRSLLEDRFGLKTHHETRELPVYALTVTRSGAKLPTPKEGSCVAADAAPARPAPGQLPPPSCGSPRVAMAGPGAPVRIQGGKVSMADLTKTLAMIMGRPVVDKTAYAGTFDLKLEFTPDETVAGLPRGGGPGDAGGAAPAADPGAAPTIFAAIQEQLGLRLESTKGPVDVLVIDHVARPTEN